MNSPNWESPGRSAVPVGTTPSSNVCSSRTQWGAIIAGGVAGFGAVIIMATLGAALGLTSGVVGAASSESVTPESASKAATAFGIGTGIWALLTAAVSGLVGGYVLNSTSRRDRPYSPVVFGGITWTVGLCTLFMVASPALGGAVSGLGAGAGGAAAGLGGNPEFQRRWDQARSDLNQNRQVLPGTEEEKAAAADAARKAASAASIATWVALAAQVLGLGATIFAAGWHRHVGVKVVTELRPRPATVS